MRDNDAVEPDQSRRRRVTTETRNDKQKLSRTAPFLAISTTYATYGSLRRPTLEKLFRTAMRLLLVPLIRNMTIKLRNQEIQKLDKAKFLGIIIDQHLTWKSHIDYIVTKISKIVGTLCVIRFFINQPLLKVLYNSLIYPYLQYGNIVC